MNIEEKRKYLLKKLAEKESLVCEYNNIMGPGLLRKIKRLILCRKKYFNYCLARMGLFKNREVKAKTFWGREITFPLQDGGAFQLYFSGTLEKEEFKLTRFFIENLKENDVFYDIGANYGFYSLLAQEIIKEGEIHAFEPHPKIFLYLKKTIIKDRDKKIFLNNLAISNENKTISLFDGLRVNESRTSTILKEVARSRPFPLYSEIKTKAITLDGYIKKHVLPTFIKLDIEGGEEKALLGGYNLLKRHNPIVAMEVWKNEDGEKFSSKAVNLLYRLSYKSYVISEEGEIISMPKINFNQIKNNFENFIFKK